MRLFPSSYDRADVLMSAGCSTFVSAALILVIPRIGVLLLEMLFGLFFIGCALMARKRLRSAMDIRKTGMCPASRRLITIRIGRKPRRSGTTIMRWASTG